MNAGVVPLYVLALCASCGGSRRSLDARELPTMDDARALERGSAGPRDYRKAAEIYVTLCRDGAGDLTACRALVHATFEARGTMFELTAAARLGLAMCKRGDAYGCVISVILRDKVQISEAQLAAASARVDAADGECLGGDAAACEAALLVYGIGAANTAAGTADRRRTLADAACKVGVLDGCTTLIAQDAVVDGSGPGHQRALAALTTACDAGDAEACDAIPARRLDPALLCASHDYQACAELGCRGDEAAARLARDHGVIPDCARVP